MVIRKATSAETEKILGYCLIVLEEATMRFVKGNKNTASQMMLQILMDGGYYLVNAGDNIIKGGLGVGQFYNSYTEEMDGMLVELYILPKYRKQQGIVEGLLRNAFDRLKEEGFNKALLNVYSGKPAKGLYDKLGFYDVSIMMEKIYN